MRGPENDEGRPSQGGPVDAPDELNNTESTTIAGALARIAEQLERQNETLTQISRSVDEVPQINTNVEDLDVMFDRFLTFYEDFTERVLPVMLQRAWR